MRATTTFKPLNKFTMIVKKFLRKNHTPRFLRFKMLKDSYLMPSDFPLHLQRGAGNWPRLYMFSVLGGIMQCRVSILIHSLKHKRFAKIPLYQDLIYLQIPVLHCHQQHRLAIFVPVIDGHRKTFEDFLYHLRDAVFRCN